MTVTNDDAVKLSFQVRLVRWTQDAAGQDQYEDAKDLVYFPRLMTIEPKDRRVIRVGVQTPPTAREATYRLVIEEMAQPGAPGKDGAAAIAVRMRFAIPVFVAPVQPAVKAAIEAPAIEQGVLRFQLRNDGNRHVKLESIALRRGSTTLAEGAGWYVLAGVRRGFELRLPATVCDERGPLQLAVKGESLDLQREVTVDRARCRL